MKSLRELLTTNPMRALKELVLDRLNIPAKTEWFMIRNINGTSNTSLATVHLEVNNLEAPPMLSAQIVGELTYHYSKLNLSLLNVGGVLKLPLNPLSKNLPIHKIMELYFISKGIRFIDSDFQQSEITEGLTHLRANDLSTRWYGQVGVNITIVDENISDYVKNVRLTTPFDSTVSATNFTLFLASTLTDLNKTTLLEPLGQGDFIIDVGTLERIGNDEDPLNTSVNLSFMFGYTGELKIEYARRSFHDTYANTPRIINHGDLTQQQVLDQINLIKKSNITLNDVVPFNLPSNKLWTTEKFYIKFKETSLLYTGEVWLEHRNGDYL